MNTNIDLNVRFVETDDDDEAARILYDVYYDLIFETVRRLMHNYPDPAIGPEDVTSEVLVTAVEKREQVKKPEKLKGWLMALARNRVLDYMRALERWDVSFQSLEGLPAEEREAAFASMVAETDASTAEANRHLVMQLLQILEGQKKVNPQDREIIECLRDGLPWDEIGEQTDLKSETARKRWQRLCAWLRPVLQHLDELVSCLASEGDRALMERYLEGERVSEIAAVLGISTSAVEKRVKTVVEGWKAAAKKAPDDPVSEIVKSELLVRLDSEEDRVLMGQYLEGQPVLEIAAALGISVSAVEARVEAVVEQWRAAAREASDDPIFAFVESIVALVDEEVPPDSHASPEVPAEP